MDSACVVGWMGMMQHSREIREIRDMVVCMESMVGFMGLVSVENARWPWLAGLRMLLSSERACVDACVRDFLPQGLAWAMHACGLHSHRVDYCIR